MHVFDMGCIGKHCTGTRNDNLRVIVARMNWPDEVPMSGKRLKTEIVWDNGVKSSLGKLDAETFHVIESIIHEVSRGNAIELRLNDGMCLSVPEKHSGEFRHVADITPDKPLATKRRDD